MRLIDADSINLKDVFIGESEFAKDIRDGVQELLDKAPTIEPPPNLCSICKWKEWATTHIGEMKEDR